MIYVISSVHPLSDSRIYNRQVLSLAKRYPVKFFAQAVEGWQAKVQYVPLRKGKRIRTRFANIWKLMLASFAKEAKVIHFHDPELLPLGVLVKLFSHKKVVYDVHEDYRKTIRHKHSIPKPFRDLISFLFGIVEDLGCRLFDLTLVVTEELEKQLPGKVYTLKNYPLIDFQPPEKKRSSGPLKLVYVGLISKARGIKTMVKAVKKVRVPVTFDIIGHFNNEGFKEQTLLSIENWDNIKYINSLPYAQFFQRLVQYDVGMMCLLPNPNHITSLPNKLFEYMSMGLAIIASDFPGWRRIIGDSESGILVDPLKIDEIKIAIENLSSNRDLLLKMADRGQRAYKDEFNWASQEEKLLRLYEGMLGDINA